MAAIVDLSHALGLFVIAEGVETQEQLRIVTELGCDQAQGFVFGRSVEAEECTELIFRRLERARPGPPASTAATRPAGPDR